jgi:hypothetical protein
MTKPDFSKEDWVGTPSEYAPGAWVIGELHAAGGVSNLKLNCRCFVYKLKLHADLGGVKKGEDCLFIYGLGKEKAIQGVKELEKTTGLKAVALMCNGSGHHMNIKKWYEAFPAPFEVWASPVKVPITVNGKELRNDYPDRWQLVDNTTVPNHCYQLLMYFGEGDNLQVDCVIFNQLFGYKDENNVIVDGNVKCEHADTTAGSTVSFSFANLSAMAEHGSGK